MPTRRFGNLLYMAIVVGALGLIVWGGTRSTTVPALSESAAGPFSG